MDDIVKQALAKWPNVPHCYGWLGLDARGHWRMRDEATQRQGLAGEKIVHPALIGFIVRNYTHDERGCWYFQNGPQRVYLNLESTPYVVRSDGAGGFVLHTGAALDTIDEMYLSEDGACIIRSGEIVAQLDDRDLALLLAALAIDGDAADDDQVAAWLEGADNGLAFNHGGKLLPLKRLGRDDDIAARFGFVRTPQN